jgi:hypothetical protein
VVYILSGCRFHSGCVPSVAVTGPFFEIRLLGIVGVECVVRVRYCEQLLAVCLDGRLGSLAEIQTMEKTFM